MVKLNFNVYYSILFISNFGEYMSSALTVISKITALFNTPGRADFSLRDEVPLRQDPLLETLIQREKGIFEAAQKGPQSASQQLSSAGFKHEATVSTKKGRVIDLWSDHPVQSRMVMDQGTWKIENLILKPLKMHRNPHFWGHYTDNVKTCTSVLTNEESSFLGDEEGALIYLLPTDQKAVVAAAPVDIVSPSETHKGNTQYYDSAKASVRGYCSDQFKYRITFDYILSLKDKAITHLEKTKGILRTPAEEKAVTDLKKPAPSIFDKPFFTTQSLETNLEFEIQEMINALNLVPQLSIEIDCSLSDLVTLKKNLHAYLHKPEVISRAVQRQSTTGWELTVKEEEHALHPNLRSGFHELKPHCDQLAQMGVSVRQDLTQLTPETMNPDQAKEFVRQNKDKFHQNISQHAINGGTITEIVAESKKFKEDKLTKLKTVEDTVAREIAAIKMTASPTMTQDLMKLQGAISHVVLKLVKPIQRIYNEIQVRSKELIFVGIGIKQKMVALITAASFLTKLGEYKNYRTELAQVEADLQALKTTSPAPASSTSPSTSLAIAQLEIRRQNLKNSMAPMDSVVAVYRLMKKAAKRGFLCFIHKG